MMMFSALNSVIYLFCSVFTMCKNIHCIVYKPGQNYRNTLNFENLLEIISCEENYSVTPQLRYDIITAALKLL